MKIDTKISEITIHDNGIIEIITKPNIVASSKDLDENLKIYKDYLKGEKGLFLIDFNPKGQSSPAAKQRYTDPNRRAIKKAEAILVDSLPHRMEVVHYIKFHKPDHPVEIFENKKRAIEWLLTFKD